MTDHEIADLVTPVLQRELKPSGLERVSIRSAQDHDGAPLLLLEVFFEGRGRPVDTRATLSAVTEARRVVETAGEQRFLHLQLHIPDAENHIAA